MNKQRTLTELHDLEALLIRHNHPYFTVVGHYRRWMINSTAEESEIVAERILSLYSGMDSLQEVVLHPHNELDTPQKVLEEKNLNARLDRIRQSLYEALQEPSPSRTNIVPPPPFPSRVGPSTGLKWHHLWMIGASMAVNGWGLWILSQYLTGK